MESNSTTCVLDRENPVLYWCWQSLPDLPGSDDWLSFREREVVSRLTVAKRRQDWRLGRWVAKRAVSQCIKPSPRLTDLEIPAAPGGSPEVLLRGRPAGLSLSISHRGEVGICAVGPSGFRVGCDLERVEPRSDGFISDFFRNEEIEWIDQLPVGDRPLAGNLVWSAKESALKALGEGLRRDTRSVAVRVERIIPGEEWNPLVVQCDFSGRQFPGWWRVRENYVVAMVAGEKTPCPREIKNPRSPGKNSPRKRIRRTVD